MPLILLAEDESSTIDHVRSALASQGWLVKTVGTRDQALRAASEFAPQLVLVNDRLAGAKDLVRTFSRRSGGPGVVLLTTENGGGAEAPAASADVDAILAKPLDTGSLIETIRQGLVDGKGKPSPPPVTDTNQIFSSEEIFGDLLDDILDPATEAKSETAPASTAKASSEPVEAPEPQPIAVDRVEPVIEAAPATEAIEESKAEVISVSGLEDLEEVVREGVEAWADSMDPDEGIDLSELAEVQSEPEPETKPEAEPEAAEDVASKLEDTLAGVLAASLSQAASDDSAPETSAKESTSVDDLLSQALGDLDLGAAITAPAIEETPESDIDDEIEALAASVEIQPVAEIEEPDVFAELEELTGVKIQREAEPQVAGLIDEIRDAAPGEGDSVQTEKKEEVEAEADAVDHEPLGETAPAPVPTAKGIEFGEYTLEQKIGVGGMASVWKARRKGVEGFEKRVAIKKILPQAAENEDFVEMFIDEAKLAAQLNHNNITHIYDLGKIEDDYFIAMEYVEGKNLRQILDKTRKKQQPIPAGVALFVASRIADALDYAHRSKDFDDAELGLVHRDVSPQNVLLSYEGDIKLCDFGIAKAVSKISTTQMGALKGKIQYMSPEQAWGKSIDHRSDLFSLGTLLYEMLTGERLFTGESEMAVLESVRAADVGTQIIQSPDIPAGIKGVLLRTLAREPDDRFQSAAELQRGLEELLKQESPTPGPRGLSAFVRELLDIEAEIPEPVVEEEPLQQIEIPEDLEWDAGAPTTEDDGDDATTPWLRRVLTRLLPVILIVAIGGGILIGLMQKETPSAQSPTEPLSQKTEAPAIETLATGEQAAVAPQGQPPPVQVEADTTPAPPAKSQPQEPEPEPAVPEDRSLEVQSAEPASNPVQRQDKASDPGTIKPAADPELERQVEEDLQRVQELMGAAAAPAAAEPFTLESLWSDVNAADRPGAEEETEGRPGEPVQPGPGVIEPRVLEFEPPEYTDAARQAGVQGTVRVSVLVDENGRALEVRLIEPLDTQVGLEEALIESARNAVYEPASKDGIPVKMWYQVAVLFEPD